MEQLDGLLSLIDNMPAYRRLVMELQKRSRTQATVLDAAKPYLLAALSRQMKVPILMITAQPEDSKKLYEQLLTWCGSERVRLFPEPEGLPYQRIAADASTEQERLETLFAFASVEKKLTPPLVVTSAPALMQKTVPARQFFAASHTVKTGMNIEPMELMRHWEAIGYTLEGTTEVPGTMSRRGGIVDIYPPASDFPARLEFMGNTIDSIRLFDPQSQRSTETAASVTVCPATEMFLPLSREPAEIAAVLNSLELSPLATAAKEQFRQEIEMLINRQKPNQSHFYAPLFNTGSLLEYLPRDTLLVLDEPVTIRQATESRDAQAEELRHEKVAGGELPPNFPRPYFTGDELEKEIRARRYLALVTWDGLEDEALLRLNFAPAPAYAGQLTMFLRQAKELLGQKRRLLVISHQASRLAELLEEENIIAPPAGEISRKPPAGSLTLIPGSLDKGWVMSGETCLLTDNEIFGFTKQRRFQKKHPVPRRKLTADMVEGDYAVHVEHGIGLFTGVTMLGAGINQKEYLVVTYAEGDRLYVPTDQIDRLGRYVGAGDRPPVLSRLGTQEWTRAKQKVRESVAAIARDLLQLYAAREVITGYTFSADTAWQQELEASFPYMETLDQLKAQEEVKADMTRPKPMDRLVCGDVGYGKTEIAIRAAFKAVMDGKQVAVLVPTTVLAQQHLVTFRQRLGAFPIKVAVLSRFRTAREQQSVLEGLSNGTVDICIGTHRLLQKDVAFKDLGLLIIDEEQRFGVAHKEHLKQLRREVDVLTLSATPIPRTLHMSLVGVRDMSIMETPPEERLPIKTLVAEKSERLVREAILRELERNGQVFLVHNRVHNIALIAARLQTIIPEANIAVAHGRMPEAELERVMADFSAGRSDILVCTTIIESGLDMPNVNTLIVNNADRFGLTQLYQLRGRIGRGANLAYAYLLYDRDKQLTPTAIKRLRAIFEATELGAGFGIALKDLEIRGAGTLLGTRQSGHISAVGFNLYTRLLADAVEEQKALGAGIPEKIVKQPKLPPPTIDLPLPAYIPLYYIDDLNTRLEFYHRLAELKTTEPVADMEQEFSDRFGAPPGEVKNLLYAVKIKILATGTGIESITTETGQIVIRKFDGLQFDKQKLQQFARDGIRIGLAQIRLTPKVLGKEWRQVLEEMVNTLKDRNG